MEYVGKIDEMGGMLKAIERGYPQREIAEAKFNYQRQHEQGIKTVVGVNKYSVPEEIDRSADHRSCARRAADRRVRKMKRERNNTAVKDALERVAEACRFGREPDGSHL